MDIQEFNPDPTYIIFKKYYFKGNYWYYMHVHIKSNHGHLEFQLLFFTKSQTPLFYILKSIFWNMFLVNSTIFYWRKILRLREHNPYKVRKTEKLVENEKKRGTYAQGNFLI